MDTRADPTLVFDAEGRCSACEAQLERIEQWRKRAEAGAAEALAERVRAAGRGRTYDVVVGLSGGGDSSMSVYLLSKRLGLRVLAVHMDNGWDTALSVRNVRRVLESCEVDYESVVLDWYEFRELLLAFFKASTPEIETPTDMAIVGALHDVANRHGVKYVALGSNLLSEGIFPDHWHYDRLDIRHLHGVHERFGGKRLRHFPSFGYRQQLYYKMVRGILTIYPQLSIWYTPEDEERILASMGWRKRGGKHYESVITRFVQSYVLPTKFGIDYRYATLSAQICIGSMSRADALAELRTPPMEPALVESDRGYVAKKLGLTSAELARIIAQPPKTYAEYPNDSAFLRRVYAAYRSYVAIRSRA